MSSKIYTGKPSPEVLKHCMAVARGADITFMNSIRAAARTIQALLDGNSASAILIGELQSGKTAAQIVLALALPYFFSKHCGQSMKDIHLGELIILNKSLTDILIQTEKRLVAAGFKKMPFSDDSSELLFCREVGENKIWAKLLMISGTCWNDKSNDGKFPRAMQSLREAGCTHFAFIMDEVQIAVKAGQQLDRFLKNSLGIETPTNSARTFQPPTVFIGSTATPHRNFVCPIHNRELPLVYGEPGEGYFGISEMNEAGRLLNQEPFKSTDEILDLVRPIVRRLKKDPKYLVVRIQPMRASNEEELFMEAARELKMKVMKFSARDKNLRFLGERFNKKPDSPVMIMIVMGLGAGVTIDTVEHIGAWVDTAFVNFESLTQSIGRLCGYSPDRQLADFPIYCNLGLVHQYLQFMEHTRNGVDPTNKEVAEILGVRQANGSFTADFVPPVGQPYEYKVGKLSEVLEFNIKMGYPTEAPKAGTARHIALNHKNDVSLLVLDGLNTTLPGGYVVPGTPPNEFRKSYRRLLKKFPTLLEGPDRVLYAVNLVRKDKSVGVGRFKPDTAFTK